MLYRHLSQLLAVEIITNLWQTRTINMLNQYGNDQIRVDAKYELNDDPDHISLYLVAMATRVGLQLYVGLHTERRNQLPFPRRYFSGLYCFCHLHVQQNPVILHSSCLCFWNEFWNHHICFIVCQMQMALRFYQFPQVHIHHSCSS